LDIGSISELGSLGGGYAQITPSADAYTNTADATTNYGANVHRIPVEETKPARERGFY
jgi:hypothetical protein